jgi:hypothetical protein
MARRMIVRRFFWPFAIVLLAVACDPRSNPAWEFAGEPGLLYDIKLFYEKNALEENGRCPKPLMDGITRAEMLGETGTQLTVAISYAYHDWTMTGEDCDPLRPNRCFIQQQCRGFNSRTFTLDRAAPDFKRVLEMSGEQRRRRPG